MATKNASVTLELKGRRITLALNLNTLAELAERFGSNDLRAVLAGFAGGVKWGDLRGLIYCLATDSDEPITERELGRLIEIEDIATALAKIHELLGGAPADPRVLAPFVPTPIEMVNRMLEAAGCGPGKIVLDLGAGDGRVLEAALSMGAAEAIGYEIDPQRAAKIRRTITGAKLFMVDAAEAVVDRADIVFLYLLQTSNQKLREKLERELKPGSVVVSHAFTMDGWNAEVSETVECTDGIARRFHLWSIDVIREALKIEPAAA